MDRRAFLSRAACAGVAAAAIPTALRVLLGFEEAAAEAGRPPFEASWYEKRPNSRIQCFACPLHCLLEDGETCHCYTRQNVGGTLYNRAYGNPAIVRKDPVEKTPLHHFLPGTNVLSVATGGCNLRCLYCQNWRESQSKPDDLKTADVLPSRAAEAAVEQDVATLCFTYTEPVSFLEYARDMAVYGKRHGVRSVMATAAYVEEKPLREVCKVVDAFCVSLKGFSDDFYVKVCGQDMAPVLKSLETIRSEGVWLEILCLLVPTLNDDMTQIRAMSKWVKTTLGPDVPMHFARFVPEYRLKDLPRTPVSTLEDARAVALSEGVKFAYVSNVAPHEGNRTLCPKCGTVLVDRVGFKILANALQKGACPKCKTRIPGVWA